jgi:hypothetical protein
LVLYKEEDDMAVKAKKKAVSKKITTSPKPKAGVKKTVPANGGLEKAIIAMSENIDRMGEKIDNSLTVMTERIATSKVETDAKIAEALASMAKSKTETEAKIAASFDRLDRVVEKTNPELAGLSESYGRSVKSIADSFFGTRMMFAGVKFDDMQMGGSKKRRLPDGTWIHGWFDVVLYNSSAIALIEVEDRVRKDDLNKLINVQMPLFKLLFPQYKDFKYYLGLCGMSFEDGVEREALDMGIGTLKPNGDAVEINETTVKVW